MIGRVLGRSWGRLRSAGRFWGLVTPGAEGAGSKVPATTPWVAGCADGH